MDIRDHMIFLFSSDWMYASDKRAERLLAVSESACENIKNVSKSFTIKILGGVESYFDVDFSENRIGKDYEMFFDEVVGGMTKKTQPIMEDVFRFIKVFGEKFSKDSWLMSLAYSKISKKNAVLGDDEYRSEVFSGIDFPDDSVIDFMQSKWDSWLVSFFGGNEREVVDFYLSVIIPIFAVRRVSSNLMGLGMKERLRFFEDVEAIIFADFGISIKREKIEAMHSMATKKFD